MAWLWPWPLPDSSTNTHRQRWGKPHRYLSLPASQSVCTSTSAVGPETWRTCDVAKVPKARLISLVWRDAGIRWQFDNLSESKSQRRSRPVCLGRSIICCSHAFFFSHSVYCGIHHHHHHQLTNSLTCSHRASSPSSRRMYCRVKAPLRLTASARDGPGSPPPRSILAIRIALPGPVQLLPVGASSAMSLAGPSASGASSVPLFERSSIC